MFFSSDFRAKNGQQWKFTVLKAEINQIDLEREAGGMKVDRIKLFYYWEDLGLDLIDQDPAIISLLENHVKSYLFSIMMKEIAGFDLTETGFLFYNKLFKLLI